MLCPERFKEKVCLVTGGGSGIGRATCERFAAEGGRVVVVDLNEQHGRETVQRLTEGGAEAIFARADVSDSADVRAAIDAAAAQWGPIHVLVNNAAMMTFKPVTELSEPEWNRVLAVNLTSVFLFCKYAVPHMPSGGAIVNTSSVHAHETEPTVAPYAASKAGMEGLVRCLAQELAPKQIRVNCVAPGAVDTPMLWDNPRVKKGLEKVTGAVGRPQDIAAAIAFLASDDAKFITGTTLVADGARLDKL